MKPDADQPKPPESKPGSKPDAKDDLKSLPEAKAELNLKPKRTTFRFDAADRQACL